MSVGSPNQTEFAEPTLAGRTVGALERQSVRILLVLLVTTAVAAWADGRHKSLWFDELFSVIVAMQPNWQTMRAAMPADGNPPLLAWLIRGCMHLFGSGEFAIRLPSLVGFLGALAGVFVYVRREVGGALALLAAVLVLAEPGWTYSFEARPYALLLGLMMLGMVSWQAAIRREDRRLLPLTGMALAMALGCLAHGLGLVETGLPLLMGELARTLQRRRIDWAVAATALAAVPALLFTYPMSQRTNHLLLDIQRSYVYPLTHARFHNYWIHDPWMSLPLLVDLHLVLLLLVAALLSQTSLLRSKRESFSPAIWAAIGAALLIPATYLIMLPTTGYYNCRYGIGTIAGIAILFSLFHARKRKPDALLVCTLALAYGGSFVLSTVRNVKEPPTDKRAHLPQQVDTEGTPLIVADPFQFVPLWWYATPQEKTKILYLSDRANATAGGYLMIDVCVAFEKPYTSMQVRSLPEYLSTHSRFLVLTGDSLNRMGNQMLKQLHDSGFVVTPLQDAPGVGYWEADRPAHP